MTALAAVALAGSLATAPGTARADEVLDQTAPTVTLEPITGTAQVGKTLTAVPGTWTDGTTLAYQWLRNGVDIPGATGTTHALTGADKGARISVRVTGTKADKRLLWR